MSDFPCRKSIRLFCFQKSFAAIFPPFNTVHSFNKTYKCIFWTSSFWFRENFPLNQRVHIYIYILIYWCHPYHIWYIVCETRTATIYLSLFYNFMKWTIRICTIICTDIPLICSICSCINKFKLSEPQNIENNQPDLELGLGEKKKNATCIYDDMNRSHEQKKFTRRTKKTYWLPTVSCVVFCKKMFFHHFPFLFWQS